MDHKDGSNEAEEKGEIRQAENVLTSHYVSTSANYLPAKTFMEELKPWSGYMSPVSFWKLFLRPFPMALVRIK